MTPDALRVAAALRPHLHTNRHLTPAWAHAWEEWAGDVEAVLTHAGALASSDRTTVLAEAVTLLDAEGHHAAAETLREHGGMTARCEDEPVLSLVRDSSQPHLRAVDGGRG